MIELKQFANGGLNQDVDENFLKPNEWTNALNIRNTDRLEGSDGVISNIKGNTLVSFTLPEGTNKCIGNFANEQTARYYSFIYNSNGFHTITEYNNTTGIITKVLQSKTDTDDVDILNFQPYELINGVSMIGDIYLYWTDAYNPPRGIDIVKAKTETYYTDSTSISLAKPPPQKLITASYNNDPVTSTSSNRLKGQLFQFKYLFVYEDNSRSAWSSNSALPYPSFEVDSAVNTAAYKNNNIILQFDAGTKFVKSIEIATQVKGVSTTAGTQDWYYILSVDKSDLISNPEYSYDAIGNTAIYKFYNDGLYQSVDVIESDLSYDFVPLKSKTLDIVNGNVLVLGNNTEGYNNLSDDGIALDVNLSTTYVPIPENRLALNLQDGLNFSFTGIPVQNDKIDFEWYTTETVSFFLNGNIPSVVPGYKQMGLTPNGGPAADFTLNQADGTICQFITPISSPNKKGIIGGNWSNSFWAISAGGTNYVKVEYFKYDGTTFTTLATSPLTLLSGTGPQSYTINTTVPETPLALTDRIGIRFIAVNNTGPTDAITILTEGSNVASVNALFFGTLNTDSYTITATDEGSLYESILNWANKVVTATSGYTIDYVTQVSDNNVIVKFSRSSSVNFLSATVVLTAGFANTTPGYKTNSKYEFGLVYYDEFNRSGYVQTNNQFALSTQSWGAVSGNVPSIAWSINHNAPEWATKYQWVRTEQLTHSKFLFWNASSVSANPQNAQLYDLNISSLTSFNEQNPNSILYYDFTPGDRCTIHRQNGNWVSGYDVQIVGATGSTITIQKGNTLTAGASGILLEMYTPKTRANTTKEKFFYEFGECYDCVAVSGVNKHSVSAGIFSAGDIYDKGRVINNVVYQLEDPNYSDFYISNYSSNGRTNIFAPQAKQLTLPTDIRFSDTYVPNTNINGLSRFYGDAYETYDRVNGPIQKLAVRDNYLMTFQELKTGYIPILQSIIEDQGAGNAANVAISNKLLNKIRYFAGDYGIGKHPESFARFAGTMYFADPNRGEVLKLTQGLQPISKIGMDSYFTAKLSYTNNVTNAKVLGSYDPRNDEYIITFKYPSPTSLFPANNQTVAFAENINRWTTFYSFIPDCGGYIFNQFITYENGRMYTQNTNDYYGSFYGIPYTSFVEVVYNGSPSLIKTFIGVMEQASSVWVPGEINTSTNQQSQLAEGNFSLKEGVYFSSLLREKTGDIRSLYFGNDLKGNWIKLKLALSSNAKQTLLSVDVRHIPSYQGIK